MSSTAGKVIKCRAAVLWKEGQPMTVENITVDPPKAGEVRVRNVSAGICASDAHFIWNLETELKLQFDGKPVVLGHEGSAIVESVGEGVTGVEVGDPIIPLFAPNCEQCELCSNPRTNLCSDADKHTILYHSNGETRLKINGEPLLSLFGTSTYSEYSVLRASQICKVNPTINLINACIIGCAVGTGFASAQKLAQVHPGSVCAVWGLGAIGLSTTLACKQSGAKRIIGIDINPDKRKFAEDFGCTEFIDPKQLGKPLDEYLMSEGGIDYGFDCIGNIDVLKTGQKSLKPWGTLVVVGLGPRGQSLEVKVSDLLNGQKLTGGYFGNEKSRKTVFSLTEKYVKGELPIDGLITHRFKLDQINDAFDLLKQGKTVRSIIEY